TVRPNSRPTREMMPDNSTVCTYQMFTISGCSNQGETVRERDCITAEYPLRADTKLGLILLLVMRCVVFAGLVAAGFLVSTSVIGAQKTASHPDLQGIWDGGTMTPLQRLPEFANRPAFTPAEAAEFERTFFDRMRARSENAAQQSDLNDTYVVVPKLSDLR